MHGWRFFLHIASPIMHEVPAVSYIGAIATASHTSKSEKKAKDGHDKHAAFSPELTALVVAV